MRRYQITPWATGPDLDTQRAMRAVADTQGARLPMIAVRIIPHLDEYNRLTGRTWRGTNQPPVIAFSAPDLETARAVRDSYGADDCFVEDRRTLERV